MTGEYRHGKPGVDDHLSFDSRRGRVVAKVLVAAVAGVVLALAAVVMTGAIGPPGSTQRLRRRPRRARGNLGGLFVGAAFWGALGVGVGTLLRNQVVSITLVLLLVVENIVLALREDVG